jgi:hypothetical protein
MDFFSYRFYFTDRRKNRAKMFAFANKKTSLKDLIFQKMKFILAHILASFYEG